MKPGKVCRTLGSRLQTAATCPQPRPDKGREPVPQRAFLPTQSLLGAKWGTDKLRMSCSVRAGSREKGSLSPKRETGNCLVSDSQNTWQHPRWDASSVTPASLQVISISPPFPRGAGCCGGPSPSNESRLATGSWLIKPCGSQLQRLHPHLPLQLILSPKQPQVDRLPGGGQGARGLMAGLAPSGLGPPPMPEDIYIEEPAWPGLEPLRGPPKALLPTGG